MFIDKKTGLESDDSEEAVQINTQKEYIQFIIKFHKEDYLTSDLFYSAVNETARRIPHE